MTQKLVNGELVDLTPEEETQREADYLADQAHIEANRVLNKIIALEASITPRRTREAILAIDTTWLAEQEATIAALRAQL
jgi:hypothetical protein